MIAKLVGIRIKELRAATGMSQVDFAASINMARTYYAEVETGKRNVSMRNLMKITDGFGVTLAEFFDSDVFDAAYRIQKDDNAGTSANVDASADTGIEYASVKLPESTG